MKEKLNKVFPKQFIISAGILMTLFSVVQASLLLLQMYYLSRILTAPFNADFNILEFPKLILWFGIAFSGKYLIQIVQEKYLSQKAFQIRTLFYEKLKIKLLSLGPIGLRKYNSGNVTNFFLEAVDNLELFFVEYLPQIFLSTLIPIFILLFVLPLDTLTFIVFLFTAPLIPLFMVLIGKQAKKETEKQWKLLQRMTQYFLDTIRGLQTLKILDAFERRMEKIEQISDDFKTRTMNVLKIAFLSALVLELVATISTAIVAVEIGLRLLYNRIDFQHAMFILLLAPEFYNPLRQLGARFHTGIEGKEALKSILNFLEERDFIIKDKTSGKVAKSPGQIAFQKVSFSYYPKEQWALQGITFTVNRGERVAIVGPSGAGKSTLIGLLMKFIQPNSGQILIDDQPLSSIDSQDWWKQFAYLPQHPYLFHQSIRFNITLGEESISEERIREEMQFSRLEEVLKKKSGGLDESIGEEGLRLSGGERQRVALTRALVRDFSILILDEPTAQLDYETEQKIVQLLKTRTRNKITFFIAHRMHTLQLADKILILNKGKIEAFGPAKEILKDSEYLKSLLEKESLE